ncbi:MAG: hypothetical protein KF757_04365 [Phycisphaeraceae bacterium]|nr:hypothetical protein [Phycisphaeraceae bacterium]MCW5764171.1 hypothetical protein [Phycisphaeraceae bacterium]
MRQWILNNLQLLMILAFVGFSAFSWLMRKLAEKAQERRVEQQRERQRFEALRTGRIEPAPAPQAAETPAQRLAKIAARREEMRIRVQEGAAAPQPRTVSTTSGPVSGQRGATMSVPTRQVESNDASQQSAQVRLEEIQARRRAEIARQQSQGRHLQQQQQQQQALQQQQQQRELAKVLEQQRQHALAEQKARGGTRQSRSERARPRDTLITPPPEDTSSTSIELTEIIDVHKHMRAEHAAAFDQPQTQVSRVSARMTRQNLRQAIVLNEVLGPPIALRNTEEAQ